MAEPNFPASDPNPYRPPQAEVKDIQSNAPGELIEGGRSVPVGNGASWWGRSWNLFKEAPGIWILATIIFFVFGIVANFIPIIGGLAFTLLSPVITGGMMLGCRALRQGEALEIGHMFSGFKEHAGPLLLIGLLYLGATIAIMLIVALIAILFIGAAGLTALMSGDSSALQMGSMGLIFLLFILIILALLIPLFMLYWFAPALVVFHQMGPVQAMGASFVACLKNLLAFIVFGLIGFVLAIIASIPLALGWLVLFPMCWWCAMFVSYEDIFLGQEQ